MQEFIEGLGNNQCIYLFYKPIKFSHQLILISSSNVNPNVFCYQRANTCKQASRSIRYGLKCYVEQLLILKKYQLQHRKTRKYQFSGQTKSTVVLSLYNKVSLNVTKFFQARSFRLTYEHCKTHRLLINFFVLYNYCLQIKSCSRLKEYSIRS